MKYECDITKKRLSAFLDGEVLGPERAEIEAHLKECADCRREAEGFAAVSGMLGLLEGIEPEPYFALHLKEQIARRAERRWGRWFRNVLIPVGAAATGVFAFVLGSYLGKMLAERHSRQTTQSIAESGYILKIDSVKDFPEGSVGDVFSDLLVQGGN